jgi:hypothetical protein
VPGISCLNMALIVDTAGCGIDEVLAGARITSSRNATSSADKQPAYTFKDASACHMSSKEGRNTCMPAKAWAPCLLDRSGVRKLY